MTDPPPADEAPAGPEADRDGARFRWVDPIPVDEERAGALADGLGLPPPLCRLLVRRGQGDPDAARRFLRPDFGHLHPPDLLPDLGAAVARIEAAMERDEVVLVHGDFDADGLSAAALLTRGLRELGGRVEAFVPHRTRDGYDLGPAGLERAREVGAGLVLTADCGVSAVEAVEAARREGRDVVVTDHHRPPPELPDATAVVNPSREDSRYPFDGLSGAGVAFKLLSALFDRADLPEDRLNRHLDLVALGTVADLVPLVDENRALARAGLTALGRTEKPGLRALLREGGLGHAEVTATDVAYRVAPRLNAVGRVDEAEKGLRLLLTEDPDEARRLAGELEASNSARRREDRRVQAEAESRLEERFDPAADRSAVVWAEGWHPGVIGIVASRIVEEIHRPTLLVSLEGDRGRGSARSIPGFHLHRALEACAPLLERYGGHRMAAGLEVRRENLEALAERLEELARRELEPEQLVPELEVDLFLPLGRADDRFHRLLAHLGPFGEGNPRPVLAARGVSFERPRAVGSEGRHLRAVLRDEAGRLGAIGFGLGDRLPEVAGGGPWDVAFELVEDEYRGRRRLQARLRDFRPAAG